MGCTNWIRNQRALLLLCVAIFYAGWGKFAFPGYSIYIVDYALRVTLCVITIAFGGLAFCISSGLRSFKTAVLSAGTLVIILVSYKIYRAYYVPIPFFGLPLVSFPNIENEWLSWIDLSLGLMLVALSEEYVFRHLFVRAVPNSPVLLYLLSSLAFGFLHAPQGLGLVLEATFAGAALMYLYRASGTIVAPVLVHFITDLIIFSGVGCPYGVGDC